MFRVAGNNLFCTLSLLYRPGNEKMFVSATHAIVLSALAEILYTTTK